MSLLRVFARKSSGRLESVQCPIAGITLRRVRPPPLTQRIRRNTQLYREQFREAADCILPAAWRISSRKVLLDPVHGFILEPRDSVFKALLRRYEILDNRAPLATKCLTASVCAFLGELGVQIISAEGGAEGGGAGGVIAVLAISEQLSLNRLFAVPVVNALWVGLGCNGWLTLMGRLFPGCTWGSILTKTFLTTVFLNPLYVLAFLGGTQMLIFANHHRNFGERIVTEGDVLLKAGFLTTPVIYGLQYFFIPEKLHIPYLCGVNLAWSFFASKTLA